MGEIAPIKMMILPSPDEAPLCWCPHCDEEFNIKIDESEDHFERIPNLIDSDVEIYKHKKCGGFVIMKEWGE